MESYAKKTQELLNSTYKYTITLYIYISYYCPENVKGYFRLLNLRVLVLIHNHQASFCGLKVTSQPLILVTQNINTLIVYVTACMLDTPNIYFF